MSTQPTTLNDATHSGRIWWPVFLAALLLFSITLAPDVLMMDSGEYQCAVWRFPRLELGDRPADLVRVHPVYLALAKVISLAPVGNFAGRVNFVSALFGAIAVANAAWLTRQLTRCRAAALFAATTLALGHTLWAFAVIAELMTLLAAAITFELICWERYAATRRRGWLVALAVVNGLGVATHLQLGLGTPVHVAALCWLWRTRALSFRFLLLWALLWLVGTLPYSALVLHFGLATGDWPFVIRSATRGRFGATPGMVNVRTIVRGLASLLLNYPTLLILLAIPGVRRLWGDAARRGVAFVVIGLTAVQLAFALQYRVPDQYSFFVPFYALAAVLIGIGARPILTTPRGRVALFALALAPVAIYAAAPALLRATGKTIFDRAVPYRDPYRFFLWPWKTADRGQRRYVGEVFEQLPPNAALFTSFTMRSMLEFVQLAEAARPDVRLIDASKELVELLTPRGIWSRPLYANDAEAGDFPGAIRELCALEKVGLLWRIAPPTDATALRDRLTNGGR